MFSNTCHIFGFVAEAWDCAVVNISSVQAHRALPFFTGWTYQASKGAVTTLTKCMALDLSAHGIRVNSISPGYTWTELVMIKICLFVPLSVCLSVCPSVRPSVRLSVCLSVCLSVRPFVRPSVRPSICLSVSLSYSVSHSFIRSLVCSVGRSVSLIWLVHFLI